MEITTHFRFFDPYENGTVVRLRGAGQDAAERMICMRREIWNHDDGPCSCQGTPHYFPYTPRIILLGWTVRGRFIPYVATPPKHHR